MGRGGYEFAKNLRANIVGGSVKVLGEHLIIEEADEVTLLFSAYTMYHFTKEEKEVVLKNLCIKNNNKNNKITFITIF